jgi:hypothetical protein
MSVRRFISINSFLVLYLAALQSAASSDLGEGMKVIPQVVALYLSLSEVNSKTQGANSMIDTYHHEYQIFGIIADPFQPLRSTTRGLQILHSP